LWGTVAHPGGVCQVGCGGKGGWGCRERISFALGRRENQGPLF